MIVIINGQKKTFTAPLNVAQLLQAEGYEGKLVAVARNGAFLPKGDYAQTELAMGDELEILAPMQGG